MNNNQSTWGNSLPLHLQNCWRAGWEDRRQNASWAREYDGWSEIMQKNYENGRLAATAVIGSGQTPVEYIQHTKIGNGRFTQPNELVAQWEVAVLQNGLPWARSRQQPITSAFVPKHKPKISAALLGL